MSAACAGAWRSLVSALPWGGRGRWFESSRPDQRKKPAGDGFLVGFVFFGGAHEPPGLGAVCVGATVCRQAEKIYVKWRTMTPPNQGGVWMGQPVLEVESVVKQYHRKTAVDEISFSVQRGEILGFLGPNGAGKTTTLRMIMGITAPDSGRVTFRIEGMQDPHRVPKQRIGY